MAEPGRGDHRGGHRQPDAHGIHLRGIQTAIYLPRGGVQARADDGRQRVGVHPDKRGGNAHPGGPGGEISGGEVRDDLDGQGGEPDERDGVLETHLRNLRAEPGKEAAEGGRTRDAVHHDALWQRAGLERIGDSALPGTDQAGRAGDGDASGHHPLLHDHP